MRTRKGYTAITLVFLAIASSQSFCSYAEGELDSAEVGIESCIDPDSHQKIIDEFTQTKSEHSACEAQLKTCQATAAQAGYAAQCEQKVAAMEHEHGKLQNKLEELEEAKRQLVKALGVEKKSVEGQKKAVAQLTADLVKKESEVRNAKATVAKTVVVTYLFSTDQFMEHFTRVHKFCTHVYDQTRVWANDSFLGEVWTKMTEAKIEILTALEPRLVPLQPHWKTVKTFVSTHSTLARQMYDKHARRLVEDGIARGKLLLALAGARTSLGVGWVNTRATRLLEPVFRARPELREYIPERPLDRTVCIAYLTLCFHICLTIILLVVAPVLKFMRCLVKKIVPCRCSRSKPNRNEARQLSANRPMKTKVKP